jgi:superfamily II DNA or RNA helicase
VKHWEIQAPWAQVGFKSAANMEGFHETLSKLPGVKSKGSMLCQVPGNAVTTVSALAEQHNIPLAYAKWQVSPSKAPAWAEVREELLRGGEVRPWVLDDFLTDYQKDAISFGWAKSGVHFWHQTGAGKTVTGIMTALSVPGALVVVTRASARLQFAREIERFTLLRPYVIRPAGESRSLKTVNGQTYIDFFSEKMPELGKAALVGEAWAAAKAEHGVVTKTGSNFQAYLGTCKAESRRPVVLVGWEALASHFDAISRFADGGVGILDELHNGKSAKRYTAVPLADLAHDAEALRDQLVDEKQLLEQHSGVAGKNAFIKNTENGRILFAPVMSRAAAAAGLARVLFKRIGTTATPVKDRVRDLYAQLDIIEPNAWGNTTAWMDRYAARRPGTYGGYDTTGSSHLPELKERLKGVAHILSYEETHRNLPPKRRQSVYIAPEDQCRPTGGFSKERKDAAKRGPTALLEVGLAEAASRKRPAVVGLVEDHVGSGQKVVLFTGRRRDCDALGKSIRSASGVKKGEVKVWVAHGAQSQNMRDGIVQDYMAHPGPCVLVGTGHAFGESLNIDDTDAAFFVMLPYTPGQLRQWEGRFHRASTKKPVIIYYVICEGTVDEHLAAILIDKLPAVEKIVGDAELGAAAKPLAGFDENETEEEFASSVLADLDFG